MASIRDLKKRIANVSSTEQLIKAMYTIASSKLTKVRNQLEGVRPMYQGLKQQVETIGQIEAALSNPYFAEREIKSTLYVVITSNRGYVGNYNSSILNLALEHMTQGEGKNEKILSIGTKGLDFFRRNKKNMIRTINDLADSHMYFGTESLSRWATDLFLKGEVDEVYIAYTHFNNVLSYEPTIEKLLPLQNNYSETGYTNAKLYEPGIDTIINEIAPLYLHMNWFRAFSESHTSEQAARMVSMESAGSNAEELIEELNLQYNRQRQAAITQELSEIVGGINFNEG